MWYEIPIFMFSSHWNLFAVGSELTHFLSRVSEKIIKFCYWNFFFFRMKKKKKIYWEKRKISSKYFGSGLNWRKIYEWQILKRVRRCLRIKIKAPADENNWTEVNFFLDAWKFLWNKFWMENHFWCGLGGSVPIMISNIYRFKFHNLNWLKELL